MIAIEFTFPRGYHATAWGRHVNEGLPEWPPSPWRILRALLAVSVLTGQSRETFGRILFKLALELPDFALPPAGVAHTRQFVPGYWGRKTLIFDSFVVTAPEDAVVAIWPTTDLTSPQERQALATVLDALGYLGRAESRCRARLTEAPPLRNSGPAERLAGIPSDWDRVRVLAPRVPSNEEELWSWLSVDTGTLRDKLKIIDPPGARWVTYFRRRDSLDRSPIKRAHSHRAGDFAGKTAKVVRFLLDGKPLPLVTRTVRIGELARRAAMARYGRANGGEISPTLTGRSAEGTPLRGHGHAFYLPTDEDTDGHLDHLTVFASAGFTWSEVQALASLSRLNPGAGEPELRLLLLGIGVPGDFRGGTGPVGPSATWVSATPFVLPRHPKCRRDGSPKLTAGGLQVDGPEDQVRREWRLRQLANPELPDLVSVEFVDGAPAGGRNLRWIEFQRWKSGGGSKSSVFAGLQLRFAAPLLGPLALGYGCHYGLGLFRPESPKELRG